ncbi:hypothetical protein [Rhizobium sp. BK176]|uniref:hypothetical protein n=1 Tax=Rhizobium sp. BK176 TaxID=2587071 RepID=UPI0021674413|nr:hypothetical protein [Rhizobium sp. BK176]MCS4088557.1 hypothetical protein [Rhizobium sp. BK176]
MQIQIRFPFSLRGVPYGCRAEKYIHATYDLSCDVTQVHPSEAPVVLTTRHGYLQEDWDTKFGYYENSRTESPIATTERTVPFDIRKFEGKHYTFFCRKDQAEERFLYHGRPAGGDHYDYHEDGIAKIGTPVRQHPLALLYSEISQGRSSSVGDGKRSGFQWVTWIDDTFPPFHTWRHTLSAYRADDLAGAEAAYAALASRVLVVGNEIWLECGLPCLKVSFVDKAYIFHDLMPTMPSDTMLDQFFPLDRFDAAMQYATRYVEGKDVVDLRCPVEVDRASDFAFDHESYRAWRQAQMLAIHCKTCVLSGSKGKLATTDAERSMVDAAYDEAVKFNPAFRTIGRPEDYIYDVTNLASRFDRKWFPGFAWGGFEKPLRKRFLAETLEMFDNRPVHIFRLGT